MCGIAGICRFNGKFKKTLEDDIRQMTLSLKHRGPDSYDTWLDKSNGVALGHTRLSIRDLSSLGNQPMESSCGRFLIVYNGEIYSHEELHKELVKEGVRIKSRSDTEIVLEACAKWGVEKTVEKLIGMFAFALFDKKTKTISLARDRVGIKPLYYGIFSNLFIFGSELKAIKTNDDWHKEVDRDSLSSFMRHNYIPAPHSIYKNIKKLEPGSILVIKSNGNHFVKKYWRLKDHIKNQNINKDTNLNFDDELEKLLLDSVKRTLVSDIDIGALLSGGIDSSLIAALMSEVSDKKINTYSIGFNDDSFNEAKYAKQIAKHIGTNHTELYINDNDYKNVIPKLNDIYDEPFADSSQIPTTILCELIKKNTSVVLSGDGGDEIFGGYTRYKYANSILKSSKYFPNLLTNFLSNFLIKNDSKVHKCFDILFSKIYKEKHLTSKFSKFFNSIKNKDPDHVYRNIISHWHQPNSIVLNSEEHKGILWDDTLKKTIPNFTERMMFLDTLTYLPDDILTKVDRASMSVGLEVRVPMLDHRIIELAWRYPIGYKLDNSTSKIPLQNILNKRVPKELFNRPKMGFGIPINDILRGPLSDWVEYLIGQLSIQDDNFFNKDEILKTWSKHKNGANLGYPLWNFVIAQDWIQKNV